MNKSYSVMACLDHRIGRYTEGPFSGAMCPRFFMQNNALYWPEGGAASQYSVFIGQKMSLTSQSNCGQHA